MPVEEREFARQVRRALARLYDPMTLRREPLARTLGLDGPGLRERLLAGIEGLKPGPEVDDSSRRQRPQRLLHLRYVEALDATEVQRQLAMSKSQYYREHEQALGQVVALLREQLPAPAQQGAQPELAQAPQEPASQPRPSLPVQLTSFIGRGQEIAEVGRLLTKQRLVTLTGPGGVGKTRLALQVAASLQGSYPDGAWFVDLATLAQPELVAQNVATALGILTELGRPVLDTLLATLAGSRRLVVLDNCEHLVDACAQVVASLLGSCPELCLLATSREPLAIAGEVTWRVAPLGLPDPARLPPLDALAQCDAVRLFVDRAWAVQRAFSLTEANAEAVARTCQCLDGIPLAIELAAARVRMLPLGEIAQRLEHDLALLTGGGHMAAPRQQTVRATIDWSWALLTLPEQALLRGLSVFAGGWTIEAAEAACRPEQPEAAGSMLDLLMSLLDKSLVLAEPADVQARYRLLETVRQYAAERLREAGEEQEARRRHLAWCLNLAEQGEQGLWEAEQNQWPRRLQREQQNFRAALDWSLIEPELHVLGLRLATALPRLWWWTGHTSEGCDWLNKLLQGTPPGVERTRGLLALAFLWLRQGQSVAAKPVVDEALTLARQLGDRSLLATALLNAGEVQRGDGHLSSSKRTLEEGLALARELAGPPGAHFLLLHLGLTLEALGETGEALACYAEGIQLARRGRDQNFVARLLRFRGKLLLEQDDLPGAQEHLTESLRLSRDFGAEPVSTVLALLAGLAARAGACLPALRLAGVSAGFWERLHGPRLTPELPAWERALERRLRPVREATNPATISRATAEGAAMDLDEAVEYALKMIPSAPATASTGTPRLGELTAREREVAQLVARGCTNRQIAAVLVISERTADRHVENIRAKLDLANRSQITRWMADRGLLEPQT